MSRVPRRSTPKLRVERTRGREASEVIGLLVVLAAFAALAVPLWPYTVDDAWITFRYSANWAAGQGPFFNAGEHVEGYSNFLWMVLLSVVIRLGGPDAVLPVAKALGFLAAMGALVGSWIVARSLARAAGAKERDAGLAGVTAAGLLALAPGFVVNASAGLETTWFASLVTWGVYGFASGRLRRGAVLLSLAALTRPEGPLVFAVSWLLQVLAGRHAAASGSTEVQVLHEPIARLRPRLEALAIGALVIGGHLVFRYFTYDHEWLPNTFHAKLGGSGDRVAYVLQGALPPVLGIAGAVLALAGWLVDRRAWRSGLVVGVVALVGCALPLYTGGDWMLGHRLVVPYLPLLAAVTVAGWWRITRSVPGARVAWATAALLATLPLAWLAQSTERRDVASAALLTAMGARTGHGPLAEWLAGEVRPGDTIALMDIGLIGYRLRAQRILDVTGLTDRHIARSPGAFMAKRFDLGHVFEKRPRWIVLSFLASGEPYSPVAPTQAIHPFSEMERRLAEHPDFAEHYLVGPHAAGAPADELTALATRLRARRVFRSAATGNHYLLAAYGRRE